jgi:DNA topoisomerase-1
VVVPKEKENRFLDKKIAEVTFAKLKVAKYVLAGVQKTTKSVNPFSPFDTNSLQGACSSILKWDITRTMRVAQSLYENSKITYLRSDSFNIAEEAVQEARQYINGSCGEAYLPAMPNVYTKKAASASQEAHECIRPTHVEDNGDDLDGDDAKMYALVRDRFIACQMKPMVIDSVKYTVQADCGETLIASGQSISFDGFSKVWKHKNTKDEVLPSATKGENLVYRDSKCTENKTKPPDRYTDAGLANKMENDGVGRPATRAPIIKSLADKGYVTKDKNALVPTDIGFAIVDFLMKVFSSSFMDIKFTSKMEEDMLKVAEGQSGYLEIVSEFYHKLQEDLAKISGEKKQGVSTGVKCSVCKKGEIVEKVGKFGKFFSCNEYPTCRTIFQKNNDGTFSIKEKANQISTGEKCSECKKGMIVLRKGAYGEFYACGNFPQCKTVFEKTDKGFVPKRQKRKENG